MALLGLAHLSEQIWALLYLDLVPKIMECVLCVCIYGNINIYIGIFCEIFMFSTCLRINIFYKSNSKSVLFIKPKVVLSYTSQ